MGEQAHDSFYQSLSESLKFACTTVTKYLLSYASEQAGTAASKHNRASSNSRSAEQAATADLQSKQQQPICSRIRTKHVKPPRRGSRTSRCQRKRQKSARRDWLASKRQDLQDCGSNTRSQMWKWIRMWMHTGVVGWTRVCTVWEARVRALLRARALQLQKQ